MINTVVVLTRAMEAADAAALRALVALPGAEEGRPLLVAVATAGIAWKE